METQSHLTAEVWRLALALGKAKGEGPNGTPSGQLLTETAARVARGIAIQAAQDVTQGISPEQGANRYTAPELAPLHGAYLSVRLTILHLEKAAKGEVL